MDKGFFFLEALVASDTHPEKIVDYIEKMTADNKAEEGASELREERRQLAIKILTYYCRWGQIEQGHAFKEAFEQKFGKTALTTGGNRDVDMMALNMVNAASNQEEMRQVIKNIFELGLAPKVEAIGHPVYRMLLEGER